MRASPFSIAVANLAGLLPETSPYYTSKDEAYRLLKKYSGQDLGYDARRWDYWGFEHAMHYAGYVGIASAPRQMPPDESGI